MQVVIEKQLLFSIARKWKNIGSSGFEQLKSVLIKNKVALKWNFLTKICLDQKVLLLKKIFFPKL